MAATPSTMLPIGTTAPDFDLPDTTEPGRRCTLADFKGSELLVVAFLCNHCPFVKHVQGEFAAIAKEYQPKGVAFIGISSNDVENYPDDAPDKMTDEATSAGYTFPYLYDESQAVAKAYCAACTPDFYVFDTNRALIYRGQMDDSRPNSGAPVTGKDLRAALDAALAGESPAADQKPSIGCNIKWKPGNEPDYAK